METKTKQARRCEILGVTDDLTPNGIKAFSRANIGHLDELLAEGLIDPGTTQNGSPSVAEFMEFMRGKPNVTAHGYIVADGRPDNRVSIEGLELEPTAPDSERVAFLLFCRGADELDANRAWWD